MFVTFLISVYKRSFLKLMARIFRYFNVFLFFSERFFFYKYGLVVSAVDVSPECLTCIGVNCIVQVNDDDAIDNAVRCRLSHYYTDR